MPSCQQILISLETIANRAFLFAILWHVLAAAALVAAAIGWRPGRRTVTFLACVPLASVSAAAWFYGNPFNGSVFALLATVLAVLSTLVQNARLTRSAPWSVAL